MTPYEVSAALAVVSVAGLAVYFVVNRRRMEKLDRLIEAERQAKISPNAAQGSETKGREGVHRSYWSRRAAEYTGAYKKAAINAGAFQGVAVARFEKTGDWSVRTAGGSSETYETRAEAVDAARRAAQSAPDESWWTAPVGTPEVTRWAIGRQVVEPALLEAETKQSRRRPIFRWRRRFSPLPTQKGE